jgi:hypothetical protein
VRACGGNKQQADGGQFQPKKKACQVLQIYRRFESDAARRPEGKVQGKQRSEKAGKIKNRRDCDYRGKNKKGALES